MELTHCLCKQRCQSILNEEPYYNVEVKSSSAEVSKQYNDYVRHETLRVAVVDNILHTALPVEVFPLSLQQLCLSLFVSFYDSYELTCEENAHKDGQVSE